MLFDKASFAVRHAASDDAERPVLTGIYIETDGTTVATDGCLLAKVSPCDSAPCDDDFPKMRKELVGNAAPFEPFILPRESANAIVKAIPRIKRLPILNHARLFESETMGNGSALFGVTDLETPTEFRAQKIDHEFPKYQKVVPAGEPAVRISFSVSMLERLVKIAKEAGDAAIEFGIYAPTTGMTFKSGRVSGVAMPLRLDEPESAKAS